MARRSTRLATVFALAQLLTVVSGQSSESAEGTITAAPTLTSTSASGASATASASTSDNPKVHTVQVGNGDFSFNPAELKNVSVGDVVTFQFFPPDHSVARAEFGRACVPYEYTVIDKEGFWSGVKYLDDPRNPVPWNLTINSTEPIFYYCTAPGSCIDHQMVGVINPNDTQTLDDQVKAARDSDFMVAPGGKIPSEGSATLHTQGATAAATASTSSGADTGHHKFSSGAIAGIVVGGIAFLAICAALFFFIGRTKSLKEVLHRRDATVTTTPGGQPGHEYGPPGSPGFPGSPYSPHHSQAEYSHLPRYSQHSALDQHPSGWTSPQMHPGHMSMTPPPQMNEVKPQHQYAPAEMASPGLHPQTFSAELEAPIKSPRG